MLLVHPCDILTPNINADFLAPWSSIPPHVTMFPVSLECDGRAIMRNGAMPVIYLIIARWAHQGDILKGYYERRLKGFRNHSWISRLRLIFPPTVHPGHAQLFLARILLKSNSLTSERANFLQWTE
jgi:hypothetical protein